MTAATITTSLTHPQADLLAVLRELGGVPPGRLPQRLLEVLEPLWSAGLVRYGPRRRLVPSGHALTLLAELGR